MRGDIKGGIEYFNPSWGDSSFTHMGDFFPCPLFNWDLLSGGEVDVKSRGRSRHIEWDVMPLCKNGKAVSSYLIGRIPVSGNSVRPDQNEINLHLFHQPTGHVVRDHRGGYLLLNQFPSSQPRSLEQGP